MRPSLGVRGVSQRLARTRRVLMGVVLLGILLRLLTYDRWAIVYDGATYAVMGQSLVANHEFLVPYAAEPTYYRHYGPLFPAYLAAFYTFLGSDVAVTKFAELVLSILLIVVVYATTKDLFDRTKAWFAAAYVSVEPMLLVTSAIGYSENLVTLLLVATVWAIVKSTSRPRYMVAAGLFAGLGFLAKSSIGYVFVLAGLAGFLWRLRHRGLAVLRDRSYLGGIAAFGVLAGGWSLRNLVRYGWPNWETSGYVQQAYAYGLSHPVVLTTGLVEKVPWFLLIFLFYGGLMLPELRRSFARLGEEGTSALWLAVGLVFLMGWIVSSFFWTVERTPVWWHDNLRYAVIGSPILMWIALREVTPFVRLGARPGASYWPFRARFLALIAVFLVVSSAVVLFPAPYSHVEAIREVQPYLRAGDTVAVDGMPLEPVLAYLGAAGIRVVDYALGFDGGFVLSSTQARYQGFIVVASFSGRDLTGWAYDCSLWARVVGVRNATA